jgi:hypothetical protein
MLEELRYIENKMDFNQLKDLARKMGGILVMNGNNPEFVIMPYDKYQKSEVAQPGATGLVCEEENSVIEKLNKEISALKEEIRQKEEAEIVEETEEAQNDENAINP